MTRRGRLFVMAVLASLALGAAACTAPTDPVFDCSGSQNSGTTLGCFNASGSQNSGT